MTRLASLALLALAGCTFEGRVTPNTLDGGPSLDRDARPLPDWRNRCRGDGAVGSADAQCADGAIEGEDAGPPPPPCNEVTFRYVDTGATSVWVSGTFTSAPWAPDPEQGALVMENRGGGVWSITTRLEPPGRHEYKFVVDGTRWIEDPNAEDFVDDPFGGRNSVISVCTAGCGDLDEFDWRDAVMYFAMVDRFADGDGQRDPVADVPLDDPATGPSGQYAGGDLRGATARLDYLADLGVTAVWLSAPYENRDTAGAAIDPRSDPHLYSGYHGYWPSPANIDYSDPRAPTPIPRVESRIGTSQDLHDFVDTAHRTTGADGRPMRVLFDYVMKHVDDRSGLALAHPDWFARDDANRIVLCGGANNYWDHPHWGTRCAFTEYLPPLDFYATAPRQWSVNDALWWAREYGIDGYRLDAIKHVPLSWLTELRARLTAEVPDPVGGRFYLVGETFAYGDGGRNVLRRFVDPETMLDGQFDFPAKERLCDAVFTPGGSLEAFAEWMRGNDGFYGPSAIMTTWIGNHDIPRTIHFASRQITSCTQGSYPGNGWTDDYPTVTDAAPYERIAVAYAILMTNPGIPLIYYGDEIGLAGGGDPDNRRTMPWQDSALNDHQRALRGRIRELARLRGRTLALTRGTRRTIAATTNTWVYTMGGCSGTPDATIAINRADSAQSVAIPAGSYRDLLTDGRVEGGTISLPPRSYRILGPITP